MSAARRLVLWWIDDGKPGHRNQSLGLVAALEKYFELQASAVAPRKFWSNLMGPLPGAALPGVSSQTPRIVIGAGHRTHFTLCSLAHRAKARSVVLMKPSLPLAFFDAAIIPRHDGVPASDKVLVTEGALNTLTPSEAKDPQSGLILLGGESAHYLWSDARILEQVKALIANTPELNWSLADSRRTPVTLSRALTELGVNYYSHELTDSSALNALMRNAGQIWVTPDSVSMLYEALTSGAKVGVFDLPAQAGSKVVSGVEHLLNRGVMARWPQDAVKPDEPFCEADRTARWLIERFAL